MFKFVTAPLIKISLLLVFFFFFSIHNEAIKTLPNELAIADNCTNITTQFEIDCYDLISYKNSFAQLRLGLNAQIKANYPEALQRYTLAKQKGNFYANALLADLYNNGYGVQRDEDKVIELLKDVKDVDPIAAYKLSFYYLSKEDYEETIELLDYAAQNGVKEAQNQLATIYENGTYIEADLEKSQYWNTQKEDLTNNFLNKIYGI